MIPQVQSIVEHLEFNHFILNSELSDDDGLVLDNPMTERRISLSSTHYTARVSIHYSLGVDESDLNDTKINLLNSELSVCKSILSHTDDGDLATMSALYLFPYSRESFNTFWSLFDVDADEFDKMISESLYQGEPAAEGFEVH